MAMGRARSTMLAYLFWKFNAIGIGCEEQVERNGIGGVPSE
jgi:hypothetical protein